MSGDGVDAIRPAQSTEIADTPPAAMYRRSDPPRWARGFKDSGRARRRTVPIRAYVGPNGSGKSLAMVHDLLPSLEAGRTVLSTVRLIDPRTGEDFPSYRRLEDWSQLLDLEHADVALDEIVGIANSRDSTSMPTEVQNLLMQLRRRDVTCSWTAPAWARADKIIREVTQMVTLCQGYMSTSSTSVGEDGAPDVRMWREARLFRFRSFDATNFEEFNLNRAKGSTTGQRLSAVQSSWFWRPGSDAMHGYNTLDSVSRVGAALDSGRCTVCSGKRVIPVCRCGDHAKHGASVGTTPSRAPRSAPAATGATHAGFIV